MAHTSQLITKGSDGSLSVPDCPQIAYIEGDGIGPDITVAMKRVVDAAVERAFDGQRKIEWVEVLAGEKSFAATGEWLPKQSIDALREHRVSIKGPLTTPVGGGISSLNVAIRQQMELNLCIRPVRYFSGTPSFMKHPDDVDMVVYRENSEDVYIGIGWPAGSKEARQVRDFLTQDMDVEKIKADRDYGIEIKPMSEYASKRLVRSAIQYAIKHDRPSVTLVHKGNIMKFTEGAFRNWGYEVARDEFGGTVIGDGPWVSLKHPTTGAEIVVKDVIADAFLQQIILRPAEYSVIATMNLNGDYMSDALAALVGGIGMAPGANMNEDFAVFEATHGTAPKYAGQDKVNPSSLILSAVMMLDHMGWTDASKLIIAGLEEAIRSKTVTYDLARLAPGSTKVSCSAFGQRIIECMP